MKIGFFDSGVGGLTVMEHVVRALPEYDYLYLGDAGRAPYGGRGRSTIARYTEQGVNFLFDQGATLVIIACNTACSVALRYLQEKYLRAPNRHDRKILGIVVPTVETVAALTKTGHVGLFGTETTIQTHVYEEELKKFSDAKITGIACPTLVPFVEEGWEHSKSARYACQDYVAQLNDPKVDTAILGCTHYPFLKHLFRDFLDDHVTLIEQGPIVAASTTRYLERHTEIESQLSRNGSRTFFTTGSAKRFAESGAKYFNHPIHNVIRIAEMPVPFSEIHKALAVVTDDEIELNIPYVF